MYQHKKRACISHHATELCFICHAWSCIDIAAVIAAIIASVTTICAFFIVFCVVIIYLKSKWTIIGDILEPM